MNIAEAEVEIEVENTDSSVTELKTEIPQFTEDELNSEKPIEYVYSLRFNEYQQMRALNDIDAQMQKIGKRGFKTLYKAYAKTMKNNTELVVDAMNSCVSNFTGQPLQLVMGKWETSDDGIYTRDRLGYNVQVCSHPIIPIKRLVNVDTGVVKLEVAYRRGDKWYSVIADKKTFSSKTEILNLANSNIAVTSENAGLLVSYLADVENMNYDTIPEVRSITRLGWLDSEDDREFVPFTDGIEFDGEGNFRHIYNAIEEHGDMNTWLDIARRVRKGEKYAQIVLAASFASVILNECNLLPFFIHLWGGSETGKTVSLMLAASVWGNPAMGQYVQSFNSTAVGQEMLAGFVNNLPLIMDELQIIKDRKSFDDMIYKLTEGVGRTRGQKTGGLQRTLTWRNVILTTGEYPITDSSSGAGAVNRIIEIDCKGITLFENPKFVVDTVCENYGFAGRYFVEHLKKADNLEKMRAIQKEYCDKLERLQSTAKQAASASAILAADAMVTELFFKDGQALTIDDIAPLLVTRHKMSHAERALQYIYDVVEINSSKFVRNSFGEYSGEVWGCIEGEYIYIIKSKLDKLFEDGGFNSRAFISWGLDNDIIYPGSPTVPTRTKRIVSTVCRCIALRKPETDDFEFTKPKKKREKPKAEKAEAAPDADTDIDPFAAEDEKIAEYDGFGEIPSTAPDDDIDDWMADF